MLGHGAVHLTPAFFCCEPPGLDLGSLSTSSTLVLVASLLLTFGNSLFVQQEQHWGGGAWNRTLSLPRIQPLGFSAANPPKLVLGSLSTSSALVLLISPWGTACSSDENNTGEGGAWNCLLLLRHEEKLL